MRSPLFLTACIASALLAASDADAGAGPVSIGEVTAVASSGVDRAILKTAAADEIEKLDGRKLPSRLVVVSLALVKSSDVPVACTINATLHDGKTGKLIAIMEASASADGRGDRDLRTAVAATAVRSVVRQIPRALAK